MEPIALHDIIEAVRGELLTAQSSDIEITDISTDSRNVTKGQLFIPLRGGNFDGHKFIKGAVEKGASAYLTENDAESGLDANIPAIKVESTLSALMSLARSYRRNFDLPIVGITGSNGKTTTKDLLGQVLAKTGSTVYSERSFNNFIGLPLTVFRINKATEHAVLEMGTNTVGEIATLAQIAAPEIGIITNISPSHLDN